MNGFTATTKNARETQKLAALLAGEIQSGYTPRDSALVIALEGNLGGGKTTFAQGFARGLGVKVSVLSPTFVLMRIHALKDKQSHFKRLVHIDAYRIEHVSQMHALDWGRIVADPENIILVEWAGNIKKVLPKDAIHISFAFVDEHTRTINFQ